MININNIKNGNVIKIDNNLWKILEFQHVKPGKGGAFVRTKIKNMISEKIIEKTFNAGVKVEDVTVDRRKMQFLYKNNNSFVFMDLENYNQIELSENVVSNAKNFLIDNADVIVGVCDNEPIYVELESSIKLKIKKTEPGIQGNRSKSGYKPATLETGYVVNVPLFINENEYVKIDTRTGEYISKA